MARNRGKKALYEVMSNARAKQDYGKSLEQMHPKKTEEVKPDAAQPMPAPEPSKPMADWWKKPRIAQFNAGRFEFSVPYQVAIVIGLALVLMLLGSYRMGQKSQLPGQLAAAEQGEAAGQIDEGAAAQATAGLEQPAAAVDEGPPAEEIAPAEDVTPEVKELEPVKPKGKNAIVLAQSGKVVDLQPVVTHFAEYGIALKIDQLENGQYLLRTVEQYVRNPASPGTDGFEAKREIIRVGALYKGKAPAGLDTFAPHYFSDAYGKNVED